MNERRARRIHDLFAEVLEKSPDERGDFLERACAEETREEVEALLRAHDTMGDFLATPAPERLATGGEDGTIRFWDPETGAETARIDAHERNVEDVAFSPDGARLASGGIDGAVRVWDVATGDRVAEWRAHTNFVKAVDFHPDGRRIVSASIDGSVRVFALRRARELVSHVGHASWVYEAIFHEDGARIVSAGLDAAVKVWRVDEKGVVPTLYGHRRGVHTLRFARGGARLFSADWDAEVRVWDVAERRLAGRAHLGEGAAAEGAIEIRELHAMRPVWHDGELVGVPLKGGERNRAAVPLSGGRILAGSGTGRLGVHESGGWRWSSDQAPAGVVGLAVSCREDVAVTETGGGRLHVWSLPELEIVATLQVPVPRARGLAIWGRHVAVSQWGRDMFLIPDWRDGGSRIRLRAQANALAFSPDGTRLATAEIQRVRLWDPRNGRQVVVLEGHSLYVSSLAWSPDGSVLASGGGDDFPDACIIRLWEAPGN